MGWIVHVSQPQRIPLLGADAVQGKADPLRRPFIEDQRELYLIIIGPLQRPSDRLMIHQTFIQLLIDASAVYRMVKGEGIAMGASVHDIMDPLIPLAQEIHIVFQTRIGIGSHGIGERFDVLDRDLQSLPAPRDLDAHDQILRRCVK